MRCARPWDGHEARDLTTTPAISPTVIGLAVGVVVGAGAGVVGWRWYARRQARRALIEAVTSGAVDFVQDVLVPDGNGGSYHVDFLLLTIRGVLVIDLRRDVTGNVFGGDQMTEWTVMESAKRTTFPNPQSALYDRVAAVKALAHDVPVEGRIVFTQSAVFPKGMPQWTVRVDALAAEFPDVDRGTLEAAVQGFRPGWERAKGATAPSELHIPKPLGIS
jgi:hypothetical protein